MASIGPHIPSRPLSGDAGGQESAAGPSIGPQILGLTESATIITPPLPVPRYEEEEEEEEEEEDYYAPQLPPDLAAARANASGPQRRTLGPARGPLPCEEEEEESEDEIGPAPPPPPIHAGAGRSDPREDAITEFLQKEALRRQAVEVRLSISGSFTCLCTVLPLRQCAHPHRSTSQEAARPKTLQREEWMLVPPSSSDLLSSAPPSPSPFIPVFLSPLLFMFWGSTVHSHYST